MVRVGFVLLSESLNFDYRHQKMIIIIILIIIIIPRTISIVLSS